ncbi:MAG: hypothetical protein JWR63_3936 [Conexibacter sp.]|nr:hypothetical protein [Conexibacter sp.]
MQSSLIEIEDSASGQTAGSEARFARKHGRSTPA